MIMSVSLFGCSSALKSSKLPPDQFRDQGTQGSSSEKQKKLTAQEKPILDSSKGSEPRYDPPGPPSHEKINGVDPVEKEEVSKAALEFAEKNIPGVKHLKICYSKLYGGWYLLIYSQKGKKISMQHWSWNQKSREWDIVYHRKEVTPQQLEFDLKGEVAGEKCFLLK